MISVQPAIAVGPPVTVVTQVHLVVHVMIAFGVVDGIVAKVPGCTSGHLFLVGNQAINFLDISLEVTVVLECLIVGHD